MIMSSTIRMIQEHDEEFGQLHARLPSDLLEALARRAREHERSVSGELRVAVRRHLESEER